MALYTYVIFLFLFLSLPIDFARDQDEYMKSGMIGKMFLCEDNGNYSPVQCMGSVCFCADENGLAVDNGQGGVHISDKDQLRC